MKITTLIKVLAISFVTVTLAGQTTMRMTANTTGAATDIKGFFRTVATNPPATLVLFDTNEKEWEQEFEKVRREDPFAILNLHFIQLAIEQGVGNELRERESWPVQKPHWAIFNAKGGIVAEGGSLPTATQLSNACADANIISKVEMYRRFLREHPAHEEAREAMLQEMAAVAGIRTRNALQVPEYRTSEPITLTVQDGVSTESFADRFNPTAGQIETLPELISDVDERIWKDYSAEFRRYLEGILWQSGGNNVFGSMTFSINTKSTVTAWAVFSPIAKAAYSKAAATVEAALERQPSSTALWELWMTLQKTGAGRPMKELLANMQPSPNVAAADWPPTSIRTAYLKSCREAGDWNAIRELTEPIWNSFVSQSANINEAVRSAEVPGINLGSRTVFTQGFWLSSCEPYLEALLRLQRLSEAEQMMRTWASNQGWPGAFNAAATIAERLKYESVARSWRTLGENK